MAVDMLSGLGYQVTAVSGKPGAADHLKPLGVSEVLDRHGLDMAGGALEKALWGGAIDNVGGELLSWLTRTVKPWGNIVSIGLAGGANLSTTVMPFILRGVSLLGASSSNCPLPWRQRLWRRLATDLRPRHLDRIVSKTIGLEGLEESFDQILAGNTRGRVVVKIRDEIS